MNPHDADAEVTKMKDGSTHFAYKAEQAVDLDTGAIVAVTTHGGAAGDTTTIEETVPKAGLAIAEQIAVKDRDGRYGVNGQGLQEVVADKGYHSGTVLLQMAEWKVRTYVSMPRQKARNWGGKSGEKKVVVSNQRRVESERGKQLLRRRGELLERPFAHQYETGAMRRLHVRGRDNVAKRLLLQAAACNLALILRSFGGAGTPRGLADLRGSLIGDLLRVFRVLCALSTADVRPKWACRHSEDPHVCPPSSAAESLRSCRWKRFDTGC